MRGQREGILIFTLAEMRLSELRLLVQGHAAHNWQHLQARGCLLSMTQDGCTQICLPVNAQESTEKETVWVHGHALKIMVVSQSTLLKGNTGELFQVSGSELRWG